MPELSLTAGEASPPHISRKESACGQPADSSRNNPLLVALPDVWLRDRQILFGENDEEVD